MKIILFGKNGQVGSEIFALAQKFHVQIFAFNSSECNVTDVCAVDGVFSLHSDADFVINATAYTAVDRAEDESETAFAVNRDAVEYLTLACKRFDIPLFHLSTDYVFDGSCDIPYLENDQTNPQGVYGQSKLDGENVLREKFEKHYILRVSWVFGAHGQNFVKTMLRLAKTHDELNVVSDQYGCPTPASDIARVILEMIVSQNKAWGTYHYCGQPKTTWYDFARKIFEAHHVDVKVNPISTEQFPTKAKRPRYSVLSMKKIGDVFGICAADWNLLIDPLRSI